MNTILNKAQIAGANAAELRLIESNSVRCIQLMASISLSSGLSHFGGLPLVPEDFQWPFSSELKTGQKVQYPESQYSAGPLAFVLQIDLSDISDLGEQVLPLPSKGILLFFASPQKVDHPHTGSFGPDWAVFYFPPGIPLGLAAPPKLPDNFTEIVVSQDKFILPCRAVEMSLGWSINPVVRYQISVASDIFPTNSPEHILGGFPNTLQSPIEGCGDYFPPEGSENLSPSLRAISIREDRDWTQLLQLDSDDAFAFSWLYEGRGHFMIRPDHLKSLNMEKVVLVTQTS
jgi:hypothetical protein